MTGFSSTVVLSIILFSSIIITLPYIITEKQHLDQNPFSSHIFPLLSQGLSMFTVSSYFNAGAVFSIVMNFILLGLVIGGFTVPFILDLDPKKRLLAPAVAVLGFGLM